MAATAEQPQIPTAEATEVQQPQQQKQDGGAKGEKQGKQNQQQQRSLANVPTPARGGSERGGRRGGDRGGDRSDRAERAASGGGGALEEVMKKRGIDEAWATLEDMQRRGATTDKYTVSRMLMKTVGDGRARLNAPRVYRCIGLVEQFIESQPKDVDEVLFNALLDTCCRLKDLARLEAIVKRMKELGVTASPVTLGILVKTYGQAGDLQKVLQVWNEMDKQRCNANAVTYGCMLDACVKCGHLAKALEIFADMKKAGKHKNTILYTTLIKGHGLEKDLPRAIALFREMASENVPYNTITYNSILDACVKCGDLATAESLLQEMMAPASSVRPDLITFSTILKGYCHMGQMDKAMQALASIKARGLRCDELVYNTLMDGCVKSGDIQVGISLFEEMVVCGLRPSAITQSILARLYQRAGHDEDAHEAVAQLYLRNGLERPAAGSSEASRGRSGASTGRRTPAQSPSARSDSAWSGLGFGGLSCATSCAGSVVGSPVGTPTHAHAVPLGGSTMLPMGLPMVPPMPMAMAQGPCGTTMTAPTGSPYAMWPQQAYCQTDAFGMMPSMPGQQVQCMGPPPTQTLTGCATPAGAMGPTPWPTASAGTPTMGRASPVAQCGDMQIVAVPVFFGGEGDMQQQGQQQQQAYPMAMCSPQHQQHQMPTMMSMTQTGPAPMYQQPQQMMPQQQQQEGTPQNQQQGQQPVQEQMMQQQQQFFMQGQPQMQMQVPMQAMQQMTAMQPMQMQPVPPEMANNVFFENFPCQQGNNGVANGQGFPC